jgi:hyperosmotically inducible periplasmic protein
MRSRNTVAGLVAIASLLAGTSVVCAQDVDQSSPKAYVKDSVITTKVKSKLAAQHLSSLAKIHVDTDANGIVYLSGTAPTRDAVDQAISLTRDTEGVISVKNGIQVRPD